MYTITTPQGFIVGFLARNKREIREYIRCGYSMTKAGWLDCAIKKHVAWPNNVSTIYDVTRELVEIEQLLQGMCYNDIEQL